MSKTLPIPWSNDTFKANLLDLEEKYHIHHPFHVAMDSGQMTQAQVQGWVANRFYYQLTIPRKDAAILSNCNDKEVRRLWVQRIIDHDGKEGKEGGIEAWIELGKACGLEPQRLLACEDVLPGVKFAVDAYYHFAKEASWQEGVCSSLTELFAPTIHQRRLDNWPQYYPWIDQTGMTYFRNRLSEARRDVEHGLAITLDHFKTLEQQKRAIKIVEFKLDVLWSMLDSMYMAYVVDQDE